MATLGLSYVIEGLAQLTMGASVHELNLGIDDLPIKFGAVFVSQFDLIAAALRGPSSSFSVSLQLHPNGHFAAGHRRRQSRGTIHRHSADRALAHRLGVAGVVALVAGLLWGARQGVQFSLTLVVLRRCRFSSSGLHVHCGRNRGRPPDRRFRKLGRDLRERRLGRLRVDVVCLPRGARIPASPAIGSLWRTAN